MEEEIKFDGEYYPWIPNGEYIAKCVHYSEPCFFKGTRKVYLTFELVTEPWSGTKLFMAFNVPRGGVRPGSRYFKYWTTANGNRKPSRNAKMSPRIFKNKDFKVFTRTVIPKRGPEEMSMEFWYSVVEHIEPLDLPDTENDQRARGV